MKPRIALTDLSQTAIIHSPNFSLYDSISVANYNYGYLFVIIAIIKVIGIEASSFLGFP